MKPPLLRITGTDRRDWGLQHGAHFATAIRELADIRRQLLADALGAAWTRARIDRLCDDQLSALSQRWPEVLTELQGISDASNVSMRDLVILNAYTDLKDFALTDDSGERVEAGCSVFSVKGPHVNAAGQTWDMHASATNYLVLCDYPDAAVPVRLLTLCGCLALCGVNAAGVSVLINNLSCGEVDRRGIVWPGLVRLMLEKRTAREAADVLRANLPSSGHHYLASDPNEAFSFETTGRRVEQIAAASTGEPAMIVHTNHYLGSLASEELGNKLSATTRPRHAALEEFRRTHPVAGLTSERLSREFLEEGALCDCIFLPTPATPHGGATCGGIMIDYATRTAFAYRGRYEAARREEWTF